MENLQKKRKPISVILLMIGSIFNAITFLRMIELYRNYLFIIFSVAFIGNFILWFNAHKASKLFTIILLWISAITIIIVQPDDLSRMNIFISVLAVPIIWTIYLIKQKKVDNFLGIVRDDKDETEQNND